MPLERTSISGRQLALGHSPTNHSALTRTVPMAKRQQADRLAFGRMRWLWFWLAAATVHCIYCAWARPYRALVSTPWLGGSNIHDCYSLNELPVAHTMMIILESHLLQCYVSDSLVMQGVPLLPPFSQFTSPCSSPTGRPKESLTSPHRQAFLLRGLARPCRSHPSK